MAKQYFGCLRHKKVNMAGAKYPTPKVVFFLSLVTNRLYKLKHLPSKHRKIQLTFWNEVSLGSRTGTNISSKYFNVIVTLLAHG